MQQVRVFSYGTLITGALSPEIDELLGTHCVARWEAWVRGRLYDLGAYPGAVPAARRDERIRGQVLELRDAERILPWLDRYEGYDPRVPRKSLYLRERVRVTPEADAGPAATPTEAWIYWLNQRPAGRRLIVSGDYRGYLSAGGG